MKKLILEDERRNMEMKRNRIGKIHDDGGRLKLHKKTQTKKESSN